MNTFEVVLSLNADNTEWAFYTQKAHSSFSAVIAVLNTFASTLGSDGIKFFEIRVKRL